MKIGLRIGALMAGLAALGAAALAIVQNSGRTTDLTFDVGFGAWGLVQPVPVVYLVGGALVVGFSSGLLLLTPRVLRLGKRVRDLERRQVLGDTPEPF